MKIFDLKCNTGHKFEGWFKSREDFDLENEADSIACPLCGDQDITMLLSGGHFSKKSSDAASESMAFTKAVGEFLEKNFDDVGSKFAEEAVKMHFGETEQRNIRGTVTSEQEKELVEDGIEFFKVPIPKLQS